MGGGWLVASVQDWFHDCWKFIIGGWGQHYCAAGTGACEGGPPGGFLVAGSGEPCHHDRDTLQSAGERGRGSGGHLLEAQDGQDDARAEVDAGDVIQAGNAGGGSTEPAHEP